MSPFNAEDNAPGETDWQALRSLAAHVLRLLERHDLYLVLAESCTSGLIAASLGSIPGASERFCGSAVVYQGETKNRWLGVPKETLREFGEVSEATAAEMLRGVLKFTPHASCAAVITGHLGPGAPMELDGLVVVGIAVRREHCVESVRLSSEQTDGGDSQRVRRQFAAAGHVLRKLANALSRAETASEAPP